MKIIFAVCLLLALNSNAASNSAQSSSDFGPEVQSTLDDIADLKAQIKELKSELRDQQHDLSSSSLSDSDKTSLRQDIASKKNQIKSLEKQVDRLTDVALDQMADYGVQQELDAAGNSSGTEADCLKALNTKTVQLKGRITLLNDKGSMFAVSPADRSNPTQISTPSGSYMISPNGGSCQPNAKDAAHSIVELMTLAANDPKNSAQNIQDVLSICNKNPVIRKLIYGSSTGAGMAAPFGKVPAAGKGTN